MININQQIDLCLAGRQKALITAHGVLVESDKKEIWLLHQRPCKYQDEELVMIAGICFDTIDEFITSYTIQSIGDLLDIHPIHVWDRCPFHSGYIYVRTEKHLHGVYFHFMQGKITTEDFQGNSYIVEDQLATAEEVISCYLSRFT